MNVFVESLKRLYANGNLSAEKIIELFENKKVTDEEKWYILNARKGS